MTNHLTHRFHDALAYASKLHESQCRKSTSVPYVSHLLAVTALVLEHGGDEDTAIAAVLHDAAEDCGGHPTLEAIRQRFGNRVADIVSGCSDAAPLPGEAKPPWKQRKQAYIDHIAEARGEVRLVALADKVHNASSILRDLPKRGESLWSIFKGGREGTLWYYRSLADAFLTHCPSPLADELDEIVRKIERAAGGSRAESAQEQQVVTA